MAVTGIGGFFFRSTDPERLAAWYLEHLGVGAPEGEYVWNQQAGPTVFSPFDASPEVGRFARIHDPEGNPIELWEPPTDAV